MRKGSAIPGEKVINVIERNTLRRYAMLNLRLRNPAPCLASSEHGAHDLALFAVQVRAGAKIQTKGIGSVLSGAQGVVRTVRECVAVAQLQFASTKVAHRESRTHDRQHVLQPNRSRTLKNRDNLAAKQVCFRPPRKCADIGA